MSYRLKPLPVDVFTWDGVQTTLDAAPAWVTSNVLALAPIPGQPLFCLFIIATVNDPRAMILAPTETLLRTPDGKIYGMTADELAEQVEQAPTDTPAPTPDPTPTPTTLPQQPYEPIDHAVIDGVEHVRYYASPKGGPLHTMPLTDWRALNPAVATKLH